MSDSPKKIVDVSGEDYDQEWPSIESKTVAFKKEVEEKSYDGDIDEPYSQRVLDQIRFRNRIQSSAEYLDPVLLKKLFDDMAPPPPTTESPLYTSPSSSKFRALPPGHKSPVKKSLDLLNNSPPPIPLARFLGNKSPPPPQEITRFVGNKLYTPPPPPPPAKEIIGNKLFSPPPQPPPTRFVGNISPPTKFVGNNAPQVKDIIRFVGNNSPPPPPAKEIIGNKLFSPPPQPPPTRFVGNKSPPSPSQENTQTLVWPWVLVPIVLISFIIWMVWFFRRRKHVPLIEDEYDHLP
ncbi:hypothetical protein Ocin01_19358 [Orchesella cincta]|uniref:Uncharacterized protein n=1 Tax=Orchesella cincta TaxID=48709 RepID=A0A1D2M303_ORCCI|nr:hypothetical protein Ocin01_19358 [Orchesella cincta]